METFIPNVDSDQLKAQLNKIMAGVNVATPDAAISAKGTEEARQCMGELATLFVSCAERYGTTPHAVLGQHVVTNVFFSLLNTVVKPALLGYCKVAEKQAAHALTAVNSPTGSAASTRRRDTMEAQQRRLRGDVVRPFIQLFQSLHSSLIAEGEPLAGVGSGGGAGSRGDDVGEGWERSLAAGTVGQPAAAGDRGAASAAAGTNGVHSIGRDGGSSSTAGAFTHHNGGRGDGASALPLGASAGVAIDSDHNVLYAQSLSQAPLLWQNAAPLNHFCNHILEVLSSQWLAAVVGADYAGLLMEVLRWSGYARLVTPLYLVGVAQCLVSLLERVPAAAGGDGAAGSVGTFVETSGGSDEDVVVAGVSNLVLRAVADGRVWTAVPTADDGCVYAQVLVRLFSLPQVATAYASSDTSQPAAHEATVRPGAGLAASAVPGRGRHTAMGTVSRRDSAAMALVQRLVDLVKARHRCPTPDLRLEAYCVSALRQLCRRFQYDYPAAARAPMAVVKLLCDFFFLPHHTPRHDVWRLEVMQFLTVVLSCSLAGSVGDVIWADLRNYVPHELLPDYGSTCGAVSPADKAASSSLSPRAGGVAAAQVTQEWREALTLLHNSVYPTMCRVFTQHRHEYSFTSRRELFSFPCSPLQEVFDFGAVVLYLCSVTHSAFIAMSEADGREGGGGGGNDSDGRRHATEQRKRARDADTGAETIEVQEGRDGRMEPCVSASSHPHPVQSLCDALTAEFFQTTLIPPVAQTLTRRRAGVAPLALKIRTAGIRTNTAAVQDVVSDASLFLLHLLAQPCATLHCPAWVADVLMEDVLLPLSATFGLRMGPLLMATIATVGTRCSVATQQYTLVTVAQRCFPPRVEDRLSAVASAAPSSSSSSSPLSDHVALSLREDLLHPSEPNYRVLVALLESRLCTLQRQTSLCSAPSPATESGASSALTVAPLDAARVMWDTHVRTTVQRVMTAVQMLEQSHQTLRDSLNSTGEGRLEETGFGVNTSFSHAAAGAAAAAGFVPRAGAARSVSLDASLLASLLPSLRYTELMSPSTTLLLTRCASLVQSVRLAQLLPQSRSDATAVSFPFGSEVTEDGDDDGSDAGLTFLLTVAAHGVNFYRHVPLLTSSAALREGQQANTAAGATNTGSTRAAVEAFARVSARGAGGDAQLLTTLSSTSSSSAAGSAEVFLTALSPAAFMEWLSAAESYACGVLWRHRVRQQAAQQQLLQQPLANASDGFTGTATTRLRSAALHGAVRSGVQSYVGAVCHELRGRLSCESSLLPAELQRATEGLWVLRVPTAEVKATGRVPAAEPPSPRVSSSSDRAAGDAASVALSLVTEKSKVSVPRSFQVALARAAQSNAVRLMRRAQVAESVDSFLSEYAAEVTTNALFTSDPTGKELGVGAATSVLTALSANQKATTHVLAVQCVQLLHLLLRWRRAGLWHPPEEEEEVKQYDGEGEAEESTAERRRAPGANDTVTDKEHCEARSGSRSALDEEEATSISKRGRQSCTAYSSARGGNSFTATKKATTPTITTTAAAAARADLQLLSSSPQLFDHPLSALDRFSVRGGGRLYFLLLWLCHWVGTAVRNTDLLSGLPLYAALQAMFQDVGAVLLSPSLACLEPSQRIVRFTAELASQLLRRGVEPLAAWRPSNPHSRDLSRLVPAALSLALDGLRHIVVIAARTNVTAYAASELVEVGKVRQRLLSLLEQHALLSHSDSHTTHERRTPAAGAVETEDALLPSTHPLLASKHPFLPPLLRALPAVVRLLVATTLYARDGAHNSTAGERHYDGENATRSSTAVHRHQQQQYMDCCVLLRVLQVLFARYRFHVGPALCSALLRGPLTVVDALMQHVQAPSEGISNDTTSSTGRGVWIAGRPHHQNTTATSNVQLSEITGVAKTLFVECGRLLEEWTARLTDTTRSDMPVCTTQWQCALLQSAFTLLPHCEPAVAEVLGRFSFELLSEATPYAVRRYAALQVGLLFRTFSARRPQVLHTLLVKAREGMLSQTALLCSTSLLALSEAVRAAPELRVDVLYTLLECWAMRGFAHRVLVEECMTRLAAWATDGDSQQQLSMSPSLFSSAVPSSSPLINYAGLCRMHVRPLLFLWLCQGRHPLSALPVACFGYATLNSFLEEQMEVVLPLALLLTASEETEEGVMANVRTPPQGAGGQPRSSAAAASVFEQLLQMYTEHVLVREVRETAAKSVSGAARARVRAADSSTSTPTDTAIDEGSLVDEMRQLAPLCLLLRYFSAIVTQLHVVAAQAPVPLFGADTAVLETTPFAPRQQPASTPMRSGRGGAGAGREYDGNGVHSAMSAASAGRLDDVSHSNASGDARWYEAAQRCLYWLETMMNTCEEVALVRSAAFVCLRRLLPVDDCVLRSVSASAGAALLRPSVASRAAEVLVFYLQRATVWPTSRAVFDVMLAGHMDSLCQHLVQLHRAPWEPRSVVYGSPEQLRRVLQWVAERVMRVPMVRERRAGDAAAVSRSGDGKAGSGAEALGVSGGGGGSSLSCYGVGSQAEEERDTTALPARDAADPSSLAVWQSRCLELLMPPMIVPTESSGDGHGACHLVEQDALSGLLVVGDGTFLRSLLHAIHRSYTAATSVEFACRAWQQKTLLAAVATQFCSSTVLSSPPALTLVLTYLFHQLTANASAQQRLLVCNALLHVWPVAVSRARSMRRAANAEAHPRSGQPQPVREDGVLQPCAVLLARSLEPLVGSSPLIASTWKALCRSDPQLRHYEYQRHALRLREGGATTLAEETEEKNATERGCRRDEEVVDVDDSAEDEAAREENEERDGRERHPRQAAAKDSVAAPAAALPPNMEAWSWALYVQHRSASLTPIEAAEAQQQLRLLVFLLGHVCGLDTDDSTGWLSRAARVPPAMNPEDHDDHHNNSSRRGGAEAATRAFLHLCQYQSDGTQLVPPPPPRFLRDVAAGVDAVRGQVVRCLSIAAVLKRSETLLSRGTRNKAGGDSDESATSQTWCGLRPAELLAVTVEAAILCAVRLLYRWCTDGAGTRSGGVAAALSNPTYDEADGGEGHAAACFQLLRSLSFCLLCAGQSSLLSRATVASTSGALQPFFLFSSSSSRNSAVGGGEEETAEQLVAASLGRAYRQQLMQLSLLCQNAEPQTAEMAAAALRIWSLAISACVRADSTADAAAVLSTFDAAVVHLVCDDYRISSHMQRGAALIRGRTHDADAVAVEERENAAVPPVAGDQRLLCAYAPAVLTSLQWILRSGGEDAARKSEAELPSSAVSTHSACDVPPSFSGASVTDAAVWQPLRGAVPDEGDFLARFVTAMANSYGLLKKSVLWSSLVPLLYAEARGPAGDRGAAAAGHRSSTLADWRTAAPGAASVSEHLLTPLLLHVMCLRESDGQRSLRKEWSGLLETLVLSRAEECPRTAQLFLYALHTCYTVLVRLTKQRGLKGSATASRNTSATTVAAAQAAATTSIDKLSDASLRCSRSWPSALGSVPTLHDMQEAHWLGDVQAATLARAAIAVREPHLALLFSQLSGESLFGPRTGCAALCGELETTRTAVMLREGTVAATASVSSVPYSVLFPYARSEEYASAASTAGERGGQEGVAARSGGRARVRQDTVRAQTYRFMQEVFAVYDGVQHLMDVDDVCGVSLTVRQLDRSNLAGTRGVTGRWGCGDVATTRDSVRGTVIRRCSALLHGGGGAAAAAGASSAAMGGAARDGRDAADGWTVHLRALEEQDDRFGPPSADAVASGGGTHEGRGSTGAANQAGGHADVWAAALERAAHLLDKGLAATAMDTLLSLSDRVAQEGGGRRLDSTADAVAAAAAGARIGDDGLAGGKASALWTPRHEYRLRSLLSQSAWRCAQWSAVPTRAHEMLAMADTQTQREEDTLLLRAPRAAAVGAVVGAVPRAVIARLSAPQGNSTLFSTGSDGGSFHEALLLAVLALFSREPQRCLAHVEQAERVLCRQLAASSVVFVTVAATALEDIRHCAASLTQQHSGGRGRRQSPVLPRWLRADTDTQDGRLTREGRTPPPRHTRCLDCGVCDDVYAASQLGQKSWELLDSVRMALCQLYDREEASMTFLLDATERALLLQDPALGSHWLQSWDRRRLSSSLSNTNSIVYLGEQRRVDLQLRRAQIAYALGQWQEAFALLQPTASSTAVEGGEAAADTSPDTRTSLPQQARVVQQLMRWHGELQLVPPSQLVRDPFLSRASAGDSTGACSFVLARLCHALASDIAARLSSHEHHQLEQSVEESKRQRKKLETQLSAATATTTTAAGSNGGGGASAARKAAGVDVEPVVLTDEQMRLYRRRIRELNGDVKRLEEEWEAEKQNYGLYRRSALNAYSRYLQFHRTGPSTTTTHEHNAADRGASPPQLQHRVRCLPNDDAENAVHAVFGFVELWLNAAELEQSGGDMLGKVMDKAVARIPTAVFLPLAGQLTAQLGASQNADRLHYLVSRIACDYPLPIVWPLLALSHGHTFAKTRELNTLHTVDTVKIKAAQKLLAELEPASTASAGRGAGAAGRTSQQAAAAAAGTAAVTVSDEVSMVVREARLLSSAYLELAFDRNASAAQPDKQHAIKSDLLLLTKVQHLHIPPPTSLDVAAAATATVGPAVSEATRRSAGFMHSASTSNVSITPHVVRYRPYFTTPGGVNVPKVLLCELSDGQTVRQLLKAGDDLRQDALIEQVFATANQLFSRRASTRPLSIRTFTIVPLAPTAGILQWVEHTVPLGEYVTGKSNGKEETPGAHERYFPGEPTTRECRQQLQGAPPRHKAEVLLKLYGQFTPALHYFFLEHFTSAEAFVERQQTFTRSVAASSMVGYLVGLGDRHINNILLHCQTAEVVHIDLGIAFDQNKLLPVPELVPFRMTRSIIDGLGVRGTEGSLRPCAEAALLLLREKRELLHTLLSSIMHDPLARWAVGAPNPMEGDATDQAREALARQQQQASTRQVVPLRAKASSADAARTLARIDAKLRGMDSGDQLSVATQVRKLVEEAQRVELLAQMFPGWSQWV